MFHYSAYNLAISSDIPLPELPSAPAGNGVAVRLAEAAESVEPRPIDWSESPVHEARFHFSQVARFTVRGGSEVLITPDPRGDASLFRLYVQGMMLASVLYQRGCFVLHASVIEVDGAAIAIMGPIGAGKSTFASAFHARGHRILADDNAALELDGSELPVVRPAFPSLKVYPEVARSLGHDGRFLQPMHSSQIKQALSVADAFSPAPLPLATMYVLDREAPPGVSPVSPIEAITELIRQSVPTRWSVSGTPCHLKMCAALARRVPIFRVRTFTELSEIPIIAEQMERHALRPAALCTA